MHTEIARPYWHSDLKWICGLLSFFLLTGVLVVFALSVITRKETMVPIATTTVENLLKERQGTPEEQQKFIDELLAQLGDTVHPLPGQPVTLSKSEVKNLSADQLRHTIVERLVQNFYTLGPEEIARQSEVSSEQQDQFLKQAFYMKYLDQNAHDRLQKVLYILLAALILPFIGLIFFSYKAGRLISPGLVLFLTATPGALLSTTMSLAPPADGPLPPDTIREIAQSIRPVFATAAGMGVLLLLSGLIYGLVLRSRKNRETD